VSACLQALVTMTWCTAQAIKSSTTGTSSVARRPSHRDNRPQRTHQPISTVAQNMIPHTSRMLSNDRIILGKQGIAPPLVRWPTNQGGARPRFQQMQLLSQWVLPHDNAAPGTMTDQDYCFAERAGVDLSKRFFDRDDSEQSGTIAMAHD